MADTFKFQKDWYEAIMNDKFVKTSPQEMAYILYAAMLYAFDGKPVDLGEIFGAEFCGLNRSMPNIYGQMDKIQNYQKNKGTDDKYDNEAIYQLRMQGKKGSEICAILGYPPDKERSLSSTKGWRKAREDKKKGIQIDTEILQKSVKNTDSVQKNTDVQMNTESVQTVQKSVNFTDFDF